MIDARGWTVGALGIFALTLYGACGGDNSCPCARDESWCGTGGSGQSTGGTSGGGQSTGGTDSGPGPEELCETAGCAVLSVPLTASGQKTDFMIEFGEAGLVNMSESIITFRIYVYAGSGGGLQPYVRNGATGDPAYETVYEWHTLTDLTGWYDLTIDVSALAALDNTQIEAIGLQVLGQGTAGFTNPTVIYVDSITVSDGVVGPWEFEASVDPMIINTYNEPLEGSTVTWIGPDPGTGTAGAGGAG